VPQQAIYTPPAQTHVQAQTQTYVPPPIVQNIPINVLDIDTTPKEEPKASSTPVIADQGLGDAGDKKKGGWWQRLVGS
jgi:hypothetical protein